MITVKRVFIGNGDESYIQDGFTDGLNIISSYDNHVGKTIVMQAIMYALGANALFPPTFLYRQYFFIIDLEVGDKPLSILRNKDTFVVKDDASIETFEGKGAFDKYWNEEIGHLPSIIKDSSSILAGLALYTQMAFVSQTERNSSKVLGGYFKRDDFIEMVYSVVGLGARQIDSRTEVELKRRKAVLKTRKGELSKQAGMLRKPGTSLAMTSPTADREETTRLIQKLESIKNSIGELQKKRSAAYTRRLKNEALLSELRSLNRDIKVVSVVCLRCGSEEIGYKIPDSDFVFDITTDDMRRQILRTVQRRIDEYGSEIDRLDKDVRNLQRQFNAAAESRELTLEDIFAAREGYRDVEEVDRELSEVVDEIEEINEELKDFARVDKELREDRSSFMDSVLDTMNYVRRTINDDSGIAEYEGLFTTATNVFMGSEATEYYLARVYALAKHVQFQLPIIIDSFRAEELSSAREDRVLPLFRSLPNQVIFSATLKGEEAGKYRGDASINNIDFTGYEVGKLLSDKSNEAFAAKLAEFSIRIA